MSQWNMILRLPLTVPRSRSGSGLPQCIHVRRRVDTSHQSQRWCAPCYMHWHVIVIRTTGTSNLRSRIMKFRDHVGAGTAGV
eukprot:3502129-Rhodomonas_salina.2